MDKLFVFLGVGFMLWCIAEGIVRIIKASKTGGGRKVADLEADLAAIEEELADARQRIEVLEAIATDSRQDLKRQIDQLSS